MNMKPAILVLALCLSLAPVVAQEPLQVTGYGVNACPLFNRSVSEQEAGNESGVVDYLRYREWLAGLVTGLTLATGEPVLRDLTYDDAMRRIGLYCEDHPTEDFFSASMALVKTVNSGVEQ